MIEFRCVHCDGVIEIPMDLPPTTGPCPYCEGEITSPSTLSEPPTPIADGPVEEPPTQPKLPIQPERPVSPPAASKVPTPSRQESKPEKSAVSTKKSPEIVKVSAPRPVEATGHPTLEKPVPLKSTGLMPVILVIIVLIIAAVVALFFFTNRTRADVKPQLNHNEFFQPICSVGLLWEIDPSQAIASTRSDVMMGLSAGKFGN